MKPDQPSRTALIVAGGLQLASAQAAPLAEARRRGAQLLAHTHPRLAGLLRKPWFRRLCMLLERATLPGICLHFALRKQILRRHAQAALAAGCTQVVVLGAGYDTLCMELKQERPRLRCIELDHPATQAAKREVAAASGIGLVAADLAREDLAAVLAAHPDFHADAQTLFVAEGLLMYMPLDAVQRLFARMAALAPRSQVAFTWFEPRADGRPGFRRPSRLIDRWLQWRSEPFQSCMPHGELAGFLAAVGFALHGTQGSGDGLDSADGAARPIEGEYIALASAVVDSCASTFKDAGIQHEA